MDPRSSVEEARRMIGAMVDAVRSTGAPLLVSEPVRGAGQSAAMRALSKAMLTAGLTAAAIVPVSADIHRAPTGQLPVVDAMKGTLDQYSLGAVVRSLFQDGPEHPDAGLTAQQKQFVVDAESANARSILVVNTADLVNVRQSFFEVIERLSLVERVRAAMTLVEVGQGVGGLTLHVEGAAPARRGRDRTLAVVGLPLSSPALSQKMEDLVLLHELGHAGHDRLPIESVRNLELRADIYAALAYLRGQPPGRVDLEPVLDLRDLRTALLLDHGHDTYQGIQAAIDRFSSTESLKQLRAAAPSEILEIANAMAIEIENDPDSLTDSEAELFKQKLDSHFSKFAIARTLVPFARSEGRVLPSGNAGMNTGAHVDAFSFAERATAARLADQIEVSYKRTPEISGVLPDKPEHLVTSLRVAASTGILPRDPKSLELMSRLTPADIKLVEDDANAELLRDYLRERPDESFEAYRRQQRQSQGL